MVTPTISPSAQLSARSRRSGSSAIRDLLAQAARPGMLSLAGGLPDARSFPAAQLANIARRSLRDNGRELLQYGETLGRADVRDALARYFRLQSQPLMVTTGSQQGLDLLARVLLDPGDRVVTSDPEYLGALQVFRSYGALPVGIPVDAEGLDTRHLEARLASGFRPKACYIVPHFHNPTGTSMSRERRAHLHALSSRYGFVVIEDDPYRELYFDGAPARDVDADDEWTVRLRSTSKTLAPGLRVGVMAGPRHLIDAMVVAKQSIDLHTSTVTQAIVGEAVQAPWFVAHLERLRANYGHKRTVLIDALAETFGPVLEVNEPGGGMFVWANFGADIDTTAWLHRALDHHVCFVPGPAFAVSGDFGSYLRLSFATASEEELTEAVARLYASSPFAR